MIPSLAVAVKTENRSERIFQPSSSLVKIVHRRALSASLLLMLSSFLLQLLLFRFVLIVGEWDLPFRKVCEAGFLAYNAN